MIDDVQLFDAILFTNASITSAGDTFTVDTDAGELLDDSADVLFTFDGSADTFDFSRVTSAVTVDTVGAAALTIIGGSAGDTITGNAGADTIEGNGGADTMDGSIVPAEGATYTVTLSGVTATSGAAGDTMTIAGLTITTSAAPALGTEIAAVRMPTRSAASSLRRPSRTGKPRWWVTGCRSRKPVLWHR
ncbi:MAG: hypothetical protein IPQ21_12905 [Betaproteobacteria bacterium]|nr:hypothetical protein [Betaproteobacteria bacterium]